MKHLTINFSLLTFALIHPITSLVDAQSPDLIVETCNRTMYSDICMSTLQSDPKSAAADVQGLAAISVDASLAYAKETAEHMRQLEYEARRGNGTRNWHGLSDCLAGYDEGIYELEQAAEAVWQRDYGTVNIMLAGASTNADTCESGFGETPGLQSPVTEKNAYLMKLCSNSMAIAKLLG